MDEDFSQNANKRRKLYLRKDGKVPDRTQRYWKRRERQQQTQDLLLQSRVNAESHGCTSARVPSEVQPVEESSSGNDDSSSSEDNSHHTDDFNAPTLTDGNDYYDATHKSDDGLPNASWTEDDPEGRICDTVHDFQCQTVEGDPHHTESSSDTNSSLPVAEQDGSEGGASSENVGSSERDNSDEDISNLVEHDSVLSSFGGSNDSSSSNSSVEEEDIDQFDRQLEQALAPASSVSKGDALAMIASYCDRHSVTKDGLENLLEMINLLVGPNSVPSSYYKYKKAFQTPLDTLSYYIYCSECGACCGVVPHNQKNVQTVDCEVCGNACKLTTSEGFFFVMLDVKKEIKRVLESTEVRQFLSTWHQDYDDNSSTVIQGVQNSVLWRRLFQPNGPLRKSVDFTYNFNIDGAATFNSSSMSIYPIQILINEFPAPLRYHKMILAGLWAGKGPVMEVFLEPFVKVANDLFDPGVSLRDDEDVHQQIRFAPLACCVDSVARAPIRNHKAFSGYYGCVWCKIKGVVEEGTTTVRYPFTLNLEERTDETLRRDMKIALRDGEWLEGVKGPSALCGLPLFDLVWGVPPEYMHSCLIGVVKHFTELLLFKADSDFYIGQPRNKTVVIERLRAIKPPDWLNRTPRSIEQMLSAKANEFKAWLLWYILPCLNGILSLPYLSHLALLSEGVSLLLTDHITEADLNRSQDCLLKFVEGVQDMYGMSAMTSNVHQLLHFTKSVRMTGPLWTSSAFPFESKMRRYKDKVKGPKAVPMQIAQKIIMKESIPSIPQSNHPGVKQFVKKCVSRRVEFKKVLRVGDEIILLGTGYSRQLTDEENNILPSNVGTIYKRAICRGKRISSKKYIRSSKRNNSIILIKPGWLGIVRDIIVYASDTDQRKNCRIMVQQIKTGPFKCGDLIMTHLKVRGPLSTTLSAVHPNDVMDICINIPVPGGDTYLGIPPNTFEVQ